MILLLCISARIRPSCKPEYSCVRLACFLNKFNNNNKLISLSTVYCIMKWVGGLAGTWIIKELDRKLVVACDVFSLLMTVKLSYKL